MTREQFGLPSAYPKSKLDSFGSGFGGAAGNTFGRRDTGKEETQLSLFESILEGGPPQRMRAGAGNTLFDCP